MTLMLKCLLFIGMVIISNNAFAETCLASLYWPGSYGQKGTATASMIPLDSTALTAAHKTLPLKSRVRVTSLNAGKSVVVTITDRGPYVPGRCIDLTLAAGAAIGLGIKQGLAKVRVERIP